MKFLHTFKNGKVLSIEFNTDAPNPFCEESLLVDGAACDEQKIDMLPEYRQWVRDVVVPAVFAACTDDQKKAMAIHAIEKLAELRKERESQ